MKKKFQAVKQKQRQKKNHPDARELVRVHRKDTLFSIAVFTVTTIGCFFFNRMASDPTLNIAMPIRLACSSLPAIRKVILWRVRGDQRFERQFFLFAYPFRILTFPLKGYQVTFWACR